MAEQEKVLARLEKAGVQGDIGPKLAEEHDLAWWNAEAVKAGGGPELDRRTIEIPTPIKSVGPAQALVRLHPEVQATVDVKVARA